MDELGQQVAESCPGFAGETTLLLERTCAQLGRCVPEMPQHREIRASGGDEAMKRGVSPVAVLRHLPLLFEVR